jgi:hypothetical protein
MKVTIEQIANAYEFSELLSYFGVKTAEINKVMNARSAMRPHYDKFKAFSDDVRKAHRPSEEDWNFIVEVERKGLKTATQEERERHNKLAIPYQTAVDSALAPELAKEVELDVELITQETVSELLSNNQTTLAEIKLYLSFLLNK